MDRIQTCFCQVKRRWKLVIWVEWRMSVPPDLCYLLKLDREWFLRFFSSDGTGRWLASCLLPHKWVLIGWLCVTGNDNQKSRKRLSIEWASFQSGCKIFQRFMLPIEEWWTELIRKKAYSTGQGQCVWLTISI